MALLSSNKFMPTGFVLAEDPVLSKNRIFINTQAYDTSTLNFRSLEQALWPTNTTFTSFNEGITTTSPMMSLEKGTVFSGALNDDNGIAGGQARFVWDTYHRSMDFANYPARRNWNTNTGKIYSTQISSDSTVYLGVYETTDLAAVEKTSSYNTVTLSNVSAGVNMFMYQDVSNQKLYGISGTTYYIRPPNATINGDVITVFSNYDTPSSIVSAGGTKITNIGGDILFFMGVDDAGWTTWCTVYTMGDSGAGPYALSHFWVYKINPITSAATRLLNQTSGTYSANCQMRFPSNIRRSSTARRVFYSCHYANTGVLSPVRFVWDTAAAAVVATTCTMVYPTTDITTGSLPGTTTTLSITTVNGGQKYSNSVYGHKGHQFTVDGVDYITFFLFDKAGDSSASVASTRWTTLKQRTVFTYTIGTGTGDNVLTYHSSIQYATLGDIPRAFMPINTAGTQIASPTNNGSLQFYNFNSITGWIPSSTYKANFYMIGLDSTNRLWGLEAGTTSYTKLHSITSTMVTNVGVVMESSSYTYTGTNIITSAAVNAYNSSGSRIVANVTLTIDGASKIFTVNSSKTLIVTTSAIEDTTVSLTITGGGVNNINAKVSV